MLIILWPVSSSCGGHVMGKLGEGLSAVVTLKSFPAGFFLLAGSTLGQQEVVSVVEAHRCLISDANTCEVV